jgi:phosphoglycolate phosphatase-like HAD superfamily hydrolase
MSYRAVILDVDGTLVRSNDAHAHAWVDAFAEHGHAVAFDRVRPLIGMGGDRLIRQASGLAPESDAARAISDSRRRIFQDTYLPALEPTPGAHQLLEWFRDERLKLVVASSAHRQEVHDLLRIANATKQIDDIVSYDDVAESKPHPNSVRIAIGRTHCPATEIVMIGDTPYDLEAAQGAGVGLIAFRSGGWSDDALKGAIAIYDDPQDLLDNYALSPFKRPLPVA